MSNLDTVNYSVVNQVATISLNRPKAMNAFNQQMRSDLLIAIERANDDADVRVVVIASEGRGFSAGADLTENYRTHHENIESQIMVEYKPFLMAIYESPKLFISSVQGAAAGIGSSLAMVCDLGIMSEDAYIYQAFAAIGLVPDGGANWHLLNRLGHKRALEMIVSSEKMPAATCLEFGLVNRVVETDELTTQTQQWAESLVRGAPLSQRYSKEILQQAAQMSLSETIDLEAKRQNITITSKDAKEGAMAFFQKRKPTFVGA
ncbi:enoyl-CoA hydratase [Gammaproteobacteria bacterium 45_16_T64]|nr:enoyl-CoA hydratase [Gammaproteobacteria bacterium 45_16_T64]